MSRSMKTLAAFLVLLAVAVPLSWVTADGTETLGPPSIGIEDGSDVVAAGTGLHSQPGTFSLDVPAGVTIKQVLLYWGDRFDQSFGSSDDTLTIDNGSGPVGVTGTLSGGPTPAAASGVVSVAYRADITALGLVSPGSNSITISDLDVDGDEDGAGILVIFDNGSGADIQLVDGSDYANSNLHPDTSDARNHTEPQTFGFAAASSDREASLVLMASDAEPVRSDTVRVTDDLGNILVELSDALASTAGAQFDVLDLAFTVPADATSVTVEVISGPGPSNDPARPDSINWILASLAVPAEIVRGDEACTPGFWKNHTEHWPAPYSTGDDFDSTFGTDLFDPDITLEQAINMGGGGVKKLARHGTAALLSAAHPDVNYPLTVAEVIAAVQAGDADTLADFNEEFGDNCPLTGGPPRGRRVEP